MAVVSLTGATTATRSDGPTTTTSTPSAGDADIIPRPNSGSEPEEAGDRGGALQLGLLVLIVVAVAGAVAMIVRESRRARAKS